MNSLQIQQGGHTNDNAFSGFTGVIVIVGQRVSALTQGTARGCRGRGKANLLELPPTKLKFFRLWYVFVRPVLSSNVPLIYALHDKDLSTLSYLAKIVSSFLLERRIRFETSCKSQSTNGRAATVTSTSTEGTAAHKDTFRDNQ